MASACAEAAMYADDIDEYINQPLPIIKVNNIDINDIYYYSITSCERLMENSKKKMLIVYKCSGECLNDKEYHTCKMHQLNLSDHAILNCPYMTEVVQLKEPRKNSKDFALWKYIQKYLTYRTTFGKYAQYLCLNDQKRVSDELYKKLRKIPEFSLKRAFKCSYDLEEIKEKIDQDIKYSWYLYRHINNSVFFNSLADHYDQELEHHRSVCNCRIFLDKKESDYLNWKDHQIDKLIEIGDYYFIDFNIYGLKNVPDYIHLRKDNIVKNISFLKKDIKLACAFFRDISKTNESYIYRYITELLENIIEKGE